MFSDDDLDGLGPYADPRMDEIQLCQEQGYERVEAIDFLKSALRWLSGAERTLLWRIYALGEPQKAVAVDMGVTSSAITHRKNYIMAKVRREGGVAG